MPFQTQTPLATPVRAVFRIKCNYLHINVQDKKRTLVHVRNYGSRKPPLSRPYQLSRSISCPDDLSNCITWVTVCDRTLHDVLYIQRISNWFCYCRPVRSDICGCGQSEFYATFELNTLPPLSTTFFMTMSVKDKHYYLVKHHFHSLLPTRAANVAHYSKWKDQRYFGDLHVSHGAYSTLMYILSCFIVCRCQLDSRPQYQYNIFLGIISHTIVDPGK